MRLHAAARARVPFTGCAFSFPDPFERHTILFLRIFHLNAFCIQVTGQQMRSQKTFLEVLFPKARAEIFRLLFGSKRRPRYIRQLMGDSGLALRTIQDELKRLNAIGVVTSHSDGFHRFFAANTAHPLFREITRIAEMSERLPSARHSELFRRSRARKRRKRSRGPRMRPNVEPHWGLSSKRRFES
jgi:hypothetical protein